MHPPSEKWSRASGILEDLPGEREKNTRSSRPAELGEIERRASPRRALLLSAPSLRSPCISSRIVPRKQKTGSLCPAFKSTQSSVSSASPTLSSLRLLPPLSLSSVLPRVSLSLSVSFESLSRFLLSSSCSFSLYFILLPSLSLSFSLSYSLVRYLSISFLSNCDNPPFPLVSLHTPFYSPPCILSAI